MPAAPQRPSISGVPRGHEASPYCMQAATGTTSAAGSPPTHEKLLDPVRHGAYTPCVGHPLCTLSSGWLQMAYLFLIMTPCDGSFGNTNWLLANNCAMSADVGASHACIYVQGKRGDWGDPIASGGSAGGAKVAQPTRATICYRRVALPSATTCACLQQRPVREVDRITSASMGELSLFRSKNKQPSFCSLPPVTTADMDCRFVARILCHNH
jgi:hypothetical protein